MTDTVQTAQTVQTPQTVQMHQSMSQSDTGDSRANDTDYKAEYKRVRLECLEKFAAEIAGDVDVDTVKANLDHARSGSMGQPRPWTMQIDTTRGNVLNDDTPLQLPNGEMYFTKEKFLQLEAGLKQLRHVLATNHFGPHGLWVQIFTPRGSLRHFQLRLSYRKERPTEVD